MRRLCLAAGFAVLAAALFSPWHAQATFCFAAHMIEHELMMVVAAPLLVIGWPRKIAEGTLAANQLAATIAHALAIWLWHIPVLTDGAVKSPALHAFQHASFLATALWFWWTVLTEPPERKGWGALYVFGTMIHTGLLGALLTFSPRVFYAAQTSGAGFFGLTALQDQQLAGLIMWIPGGVVYLAVDLWVLALLLRRRERPLMRSGPA